MKTLGELFKYVNKFEKEMLAKYPKDTGLIAGIMDNWRALIIRKQEERKS